jgi:hypothetical protein
MRLEVSRYVESDLEAIAEFIAEDNPDRAVPAAMTQEPVVTEDTFSRFASAIPCKA